MKTLSQQNQVQPEAIAQARRQVVGLVLIEESEGFPEHVQVQAVDAALTALSEGRSAHFALSQGRAVIHDHHA